MSLPTAIVLAAAMICVTQLALVFTALIWMATHHS
jgi:hypothetical protein